MDGETITRAQRAILSALAIAPGEVFTAEHLVDAVWPLEVPTSARSSLQNQLSRLRRSFGADLFETSRNGYRLLAPTDLELFEALADAGCSAAIPPAEAVVLLTRAVGLWAGRPFEALVDHPGADCEATRLGVMMQGVEESLAVARISLGDHETAVHYLEVMVEAEPYRERRWELLMTALSSAGRTAEAMATYQRMSTVLREELGVSPPERLTVLRDLIASGSPLGAPVADLTEGGNPAACGGPAPIRHRARCTASYRTHRAPGEAA